MAKLKRRAALSAAALCLLLAVTAASAYIRDSRVRALPAQSGQIMAEALDPLTAFRTERAQLRERQRAELNDIIHDAATDPDTLSSAKRRLMELMDSERAETDIEGVNKDHIIGWVGGMDIPVLHDFYTGYEQGAQYIDPDIQILQAFAGEWQNPLKGKELTLAQYDQGADIVMNVASGTGAGVLEAAKEAGKYAIGVDLNQDNDQPGSVLTSMVKRVDNACYLVIKSVVDGSFKGGTTQYLDLAKGGVSLTDFSVMKEALGDKFPQDIVDKVNDLSDQIISGKIVVDNYEGFGPGSAESTVESAVESAAE